MTQSIGDFQTWGESLEGSQPPEILRAAVARYGPRIILACSFGAEDVVLVDMLHRIDPSVGLFYLDTDFLFSETYATRDRIIERYEIENGGLRGDKEKLYELLDSANREKLMLIEGDRDSKASRRHRLGNRCAQSNGRAGQEPRS